MKNTGSLVTKHCIPCHDGGFALEQKQIDRLLVELQNKWQINKSGHLYKNYSFTNFIEAISFANQIALIAEQESHHPDLNISWGICAVEIWTHKINGLTESDFILAAKIESIKNA